MMSFLGSQVLAANRDLLVKGFGDVGAVLEHGTDGYLALGAWIAWGYRF
jgi:hypothetical protein